MKNLKLKMLLFGLCTIVATQTTFAQDNSRAAEEKAELKREMNKVGDVSNVKLKELKTLRAKYEEATPAERVAISEEIEALKLSYNQAVKGVDGDRVNLEEAQKAKVIAEDLKFEADAKALRIDKEFNHTERKAFIIDAKKRISIAKKRVLSEEETGVISEEEAKQRKIKISKIEEKLALHEVSVSDAKVKIEQRMEELRLLQK